MAPNYGGRNIAVSNTDLTPAHALNLLIEDTATDLRIQGARTLRALVAAGRVRDTRQTRQDWTVTGEGADVKNYRVEDVTTADPTDKRDKAHVQIGEYKLAHRMKVNRVALQEATARGPEAVQDLFNDQLYVGLRKIHKKLNTYLYTGDGSLASAGMNGLLEGYGSGAFEGVDPADIPEWVPIVLDNGGIARRLTRDLMRDFDTLVSLEEAGYNFVIMNPETAKAYSKEYDNIAGSLNAQGRGQDTRNADLGFYGKTFNGIMILEDPECPETAVYAMDVNTIRLLFFVLDNQPSSPNVNPIVINRSFGFPIHIAELTTGTSVIRELELYVMPQVRVTNRRGLLAISDIDPALTFAEPSPE